MGWLGDGSHRGQVRHALMAVGLPPQYPRGTDRQTEVCAVSVRPLLPVRESSIIDIITVFWSVSRWLNWYISPSRTTQHTCTTGSYPSHVQQDHTHHIVWSYLIHSTQSTLTNRDVILWDSLVNRVTYNVHLHVSDTLYRVHRAL